MYICYELWILDNCWRSSGHMSLRDFGKITWLFYIFQSLMWKCIVLKSWIDEIDNKFSRIQFHHILYFYINPYSHLSYEEEGKEERKKRGGKWGILGDRLSPRAWHDDHEGLWIVCIKERTAWKRKWNPLRKVPLRRLEILIECNPFFSSLFVSSLSFPFISMEIPFFQFLILLLFKPFPSFFFFYPIFIILFHNSFSSSFPSIFSLFLFHLCHLSSFLFPV